jgi:hypothetical protein
MSEPNHQTSLIRVMMIGTSLSFAALAAIAVSMKDFFGGNAVFQFTWKTPVAFVVGWLTGWVFWRVVRGRMSKN